MPMKPLDRKVELVRREINLAQIGRQLGVTRHHVAMVVGGRRRSPSVEAAVSEAIGLPMEEVFGPAVRANAFAP